MDFHSFDAFNAGVKAGGLRNRSEIRLLVCYLLSAVDAPVERDVLVNAVIGEGLANFFELNEAIDELLHTGNVRTADDGGVEALTATDAGRHSAELLETTLPRSVREQAVNATLRLMKLARNRRQNHVQIDALPDGGCNVTFLLKDEKTEWMRLTMYVADRLQAETVRANFLEDPVKLYAGILDALTKPASPGE